MFRSTFLTRLITSNTANMLRLTMGKLPLATLCIAKKSFSQLTKCKTLKFDASWYVSKQPVVISSMLLSTSSGSTMEESTSKEGFRVITPKKKRKTGQPDISVTFKLPTGEKLVAKGREGDSLLDLVSDNNLDIDGFGACEGTLACSTCHLIFSKEDYEKLPKRPTDEEMDMLDLAFDLCDTSRLGCQVILTKSMNDLEVVVPASVNDQRLC